MIVSSGDDGVSGYNTRVNPGACGFFPLFPASSPHVTTVGATQGPESGTPEVVCEADAAIATPPVITSGGGFSGIFGQPNWQTGAVAAYLSSGVQLPPASAYGSGRAYPDIAGMGHAYPIILAGTNVSTPRHVVCQRGSVVDAAQTAVDGTSASAPLLASMVAHINARRAAVGKPPLGFLNPALYLLNSSAFHDITSGCNACGAGSPPTCCPNGFFAYTGAAPRACVLACDVAAPNVRAAGWDPTTGLGSPKFEAMSAQLGAPPPMPTPTPSATATPVPNPDDGGGTSSAAGARARLCDRLLFQLLTQCAVRMVAQLVAS